MSELTLVDIIKILLFGYPVPSEFIDTSYPAFLQTVGGLALTLVITVISFGIGTVAAALFAFIIESEKVICTNKTWILVVMSFFQRIIKMFVHITRSLPILILVLLFYYLPYPLFKIRIPAVILGICAFSLYASSYLTEVFRSGFRSVPEGLTASSRTIGLNQLQQFSHIKLPLVLRVMAPAIIGIAITVFKDTSVLMAAGVAEITFTARQLSAASPGHYSLVLFLVIVMYWAIASAFSLFAGSIEKKFHIYGWGGKI